MNNQECARGSGEQRHRIIQQVLRRGGWVRDVLYAHGAHPDTEQWQHASGIQVAAELLTRLTNIQVQSVALSFDSERIAFVQDAMNTLQTQSYGMIVPYAGTESEADRPKRVTYVSFRADLPA